MDIWVEGISQSSARLLRFANSFGLYEIRAENVIENFDKYNGNSVNLNL